MLLTLLEDATLSLRLTFVCACTICTVLFFTMASKRKRVVLSLADKLKIIEQLDKGVTGKKLSEIYGVGQATICDIKNSKPTLLTLFRCLKMKMEVPPGKQ